MVRYHPYRHSHDFVIPLLYLHMGRRTGHYTVSTHTPIATFEGLHAAHPSILNLRLINLQSRRPYAVCLNDEFDEQGEIPEWASQLIGSMFEALFPNKSAFEL